MKGNIWAFLLDFDGVIFPNDLVAQHLIQTLNLTESVWSESYEAAKNGSHYVDYDKIIAHIAKSQRIEEDHMWRILDKMIREPVFSQYAAQDAIRCFKQMGHVEMVTQGAKRYQNAKLEASEMITLLGKENIRVINEDKKNLLEQRALKLIEQGHKHIFLIDDRPGILSIVQQSFPENIIAIRIQTGKYASELDPENSYLKSPDMRSWITVPSIIKARGVVEAIHSGSPEGVVASISGRMRR